MSDYELPSPQELILDMKSRGLTQAEIANLSGLPQSTISKIERGSVKDIMLLSYRGLQLAFLKSKRETLGEEEIQRSCSLLREALLHMSDATRDGREARMLVESVIKLLGRAS